MSFHFIFAVDYIRDKNVLYSVFFMKKLYSVQVVMLNVDRHQMQLCVKNHFVGM